jgi:transposase-like protein
MKQAENGLVTETTDPTVNKSPRLGVPHITYPKELKKEIIARVKDGDAVATLASLYKVTPSSIYLWLAKAKGFGRKKGVRRNYAKFANNNHAPQGPTKPKAAAPSAAPANNTMSYLSGLPDRIKLALSKINEAADILANL